MDRQTRDKKLAWALLLKKISSDSWKKDEKILKDVRSLAKITCGDIVKNRKKLCKTIGVYRENKLLAKGKISDISKKFNLTKTEVYNFIHNKNTDKQGRKFKYLKECDT